MRKEFIKKEIKASEEAIKSLTETRDKCIEGLELQEIILERIKQEL